MTLIEVKVNPTEGPDQIHLTHLCPQQHKQDQDEFGHNAQNKAYLQQSLQGYIDHHGLYSYFVKPCVACF